MSEVAQLCLTLCDPMECSLTRFLHPWDFPGKNTGVGCHFLLQEIFPTQGLKPGLPHCRQTLYCLSHQGSPPQSKYSWSLNKMDLYCLESSYMWWLLFFHWVLKYYKIRGWRANYKFYTDFQFCRGWIPQSFPKTPPTRSCSRISCTWVVVLGSGDKSTANCILKQWCKLLLTIHTGTDLIADSS